MTETDIKKILIVEDNIENINLIQYYLKPLGHEIISVEDGEEAIPAVEKNKPDLILLDIMLPGMDGFEICRTLKKDTRYKHIPIIMITALKELKDKVKSLEAGADDFISKPFESVELLARVKSLFKIKEYYDNLQEKNTELLQKIKQIEILDNFKDELIKLIVHDLKNPLFVVQGNVQMMEMALENNTVDLLRKYVDRIDRSSNQLHKMILNLLDISRIKDGSIELKEDIIDINSTIKNIVDKIKDYPENQSKNIELNFYEKLGSTILDASIVERVLDNLICYAYENVDKNGLVTIDTAKTENMISIMITDNGKEIPEELQEKLFDQYEQYNLKKNGLRISRALGFVFCKLAVEAHSGTLQLKKAKEKGNKFTLSFPTK